MNRWKHQNQPYGNYPSRFPLSVLKSFPLHQKLSSTLAAKSRSLIVLFLAFGLGALVASRTLQAAPPVYTVPRLKKLKPKWENLVGTEIKVEGRYALSTGKGLRFQNCDLLFRLDEDVSKPSGQSRTIEVTGHLQRKNGDFTFQVQRLQEKTSDLDTFLIRKSKIQDEKPEQWYALAEWATRRSRFYEDKELARQAQNAYLKGIQSERRQLKENNPQELFALAEKAQKFELPTKIIREFRHQACWQLWDAYRTREKKKPTIDELAQRIAKELPGSKTALKSIPTELREKYLKNPLTVYRSADDKQRPVLHRLLYSEVVLAGILEDVKKDGSNGYEIAERIEKKLPEQRALAEIHRLRELNYRLSHVENLTRDEARELSKAFARRNRDDKSKRTLQKWLKSREEQLRQDGPAGLLQLSEEYINLLEDKQKAADLLKEAYKKNPESTEIADRLEQLGYQFQKGRWLGTEQIDSMPDDPIQRAMREGRIALGMTSPQVRRTLGNPTSVARMASSGQVSEIWIYGEQGASRLAVYLSRRSRQEKSQSEVVGVSQLKP